MATTADAFCLRARTRTSVTCHIIIFGLGRHNGAEAPCRTERKVGRWPPLRHRCRDVDAGPVGAALGGYSCFSVSGACEVSAAAMSAGRDGDTPGGGGHRSGALGVIDGELRDCWAGTRPRSRRTTSDETPPRNRGRRSASHLPRLDEQRRGPVRWSIPQGRAGSGESTHWRRMSPIQGRCRCKRGYLALSAARRAAVLFAPHWNPVKEQS